MSVPYQFPDLSTLYIFKLLSINRNNNVIRNSVGKTFAADGKNFSFLFIEWKLVSCGPMNRFRLKLLRLKKFGDDLYPNN